MMISDLKQMLLQRSTQNVLIFLYGDYYEWHINKMKRDITFNEYVDIFNTCDYSYMFMKKPVETSFNMYL
jgi:hypothetical protein